MMEVHGWIRDGYDIDTDVDKTVTILRMIEVTILFM